jgi:tetratricopeptide (TPR) repeat protein
MASGVALPELEVFAEAVLAADPDEPGALGVAARASLAAGDACRAQACARRLLAVVPGSILARTVLASVAEANGELHQALAQRVAAVGLAPDRADLHAELAALYETMGLRTDARRHLRHAQRLGGWLYDPR